MTRVRTPLQLLLVLTLPLAMSSLISQASRTVMAIIGPLLATEFSLSASELGLLGACMFATYGAAQLPVGVALDMFGPRRIQTALGLLAAAGFAMFALSNGLAGFAIARAIIGIGIAAALMAVIKVNTQWFAPTQVATMTGMAMMVGSLGSVLTTAPVQAALPALGWRGVFWILCGTSVLSALWIFISVRDKPATGARRSLRREGAVMGRILGSRLFWRYGPAASMLTILNFTYLGLWAGPWLRDVAGYDGAARAHTLLLYALAMMLGGPVIGWAAGRTQARGWSVMLVPALCTGGLMAAQIGLMLQPATPILINGLWVMFAFCGAGGPTGYIAVSQMFPVEQTARVATAINALTLTCAFVLQAAIGAILDQWPRTTSGGWDPHGYSAALALSLGMQVLVAIHVSGIAVRRLSP